MEICSKFYSLATSSEVKIELEAWFNSEEINKMLDKIKIHDVSDKEKYNSLLSYLQNRYPYLGVGELSTFLVAILYYELEGKSYYYITDDRKMKNKIPSIVNDELFIKQLDAVITKFNVADTVKIIKRLKDRKAISIYNIEEIIRDLNKGTYNIDQDQREFLMRESHED